MVTPGVSDELGQSGSRAEVHLLAKARGCGGVALQRYCG